LVGDTGIIFVHNKGRALHNGSERGDGGSAGGATSLVAHEGWFHYGGLDLREDEPRDPDGDHVDLARGIALGIVVGIVMWGLAALIVWAMWR
jgi:hypothetical protein